MRLVAGVFLLSLVLAEAARAQPAKPAAAAAFPTGVYTGEVHRSDPRIKGMPDCRYDDDKRVTLTVYPDGTVTWVGYAYAHIDCPDENATPSSCWHEGRGQIEASRRKWRLRSAVIDSIAGPVEGSGRRVWKCKRLRVVLPDELEPSDRSCVLLGRDDSDDMMISAIVEEGCRLGAENTWSDFADVEVAKAGVNLTLPVSGLGKKKLKLTLTRTADAPSIPPPPPLSAVELLVSMKTHRDEMCACEDAACSDAVRVRFDELMAR